MIALDTSSTTTGYAIYENAVLKRHDVIDLSRAKCEPYIRVKNMKIRLITLLKQEKPDIIVVETNWKKQNIKVVQTLSEIMGVVEGYALTNNVDYVRLAPSKWRSLIQTSYPKNRKELKIWAVDTTKNIYPNIKIKTDDEADAILIGQALINEYDRLQN